MLSWFTVSSPNATQSTGGREPSLKNPTIDERLSSENSGLRDTSRCLCLGVQAGTGCRLTREPLTTNLPRHGLCLESWPGQARRKTTMPQLIFKGSLHQKNTMVSGIYKQSHQGWLTETWNLRKQKNNLLFLKKKVIFYLIICITIKFLLYSKLRHVILGKAYLLYSFSLLNRMLSYF